MPYRTLILCLALLLASVGGVLAAEQQEKEEENLLQNPGFESGAEGWQLPSTFVVVSDVAHSGEKSLRQVNGSPGVYQMATQKIPFRAGQQYRFSAWIKTQSVQGNDSGATICMEWSGAKGWLGGAYPSGKRGTNDWFHVSATTPVIPKDATSVTMTLYLRRNMTGMAWFDDVRVEEAYPPPFDAALLWPNYRGALRSDTPDQRFLVRARVAERMRGGRTPAGTVLVCALLKGDATLREVSVRKPKPGYNDLSLDARRLAPGDYRVRVTLLDADRKPLGQREFAVTKLPPGAPLPRVCIDAHNRLLVEGKPFFPLGWYFGPGPTSADYPAHFDRLAASPFNTIMCYGVSEGGVERVRAYLDELDKRKLKILYSIKDVYEGTQWFKDPVLGFSGEEGIVHGVIEAFRKHPALLGWYLNDELPLDVRDRLEARYELVRRLDPDHPTWSVLYQVDQLFGYLNSADVLGSDPYPVPERPVTVAGDWTRMSSDISAGKRPLWQVPQAHDWGCYREDEKEKLRAPTRAEERVMTYLCLIQGAHGLIYYSYFDLQRDRAGFDQRWADMVAVGNEVKALFPALLSAAPAPKLAVRPLSAGVQYALRAGDDGAGYVLLANTDPKHPAHVRVAVPRGAGLFLMRGAETKPFTGGTQGGWCEVGLDPMDACTLIVRPA